MPDLNLDSRNAWTVDLRAREARSLAADVTFRWTTDGRPQVYLVRPHLPGLSECDAWHIAQAAQRAITAASPNVWLTPSGVAVDPVV
jgi:hypothetical protein